MLLGRGGHFKKLGRLPTISTLFCILPKGHLFDTMTISEDTDTPITSYLAYLGKNYLKDITRFFTGIMENNNSESSPCLILESFFSLVDEPIGVRVMPYNKPFAVRQILSATDADEVKTPNDKVEPKN
ncbi:hypothetical protein YC2023_071289 [Brassica napus]